MNGAWSTELPVASDGIVLVVFLDKNGGVVNNGLRPSRFVGGDSLRGYQTYLRVSREDSSSHFYRDPNQSAPDEVAWVINLPD